MRYVDEANPPGGDMGSLGTANLMLIRQFDFPYVYEENEPHQLIDHDRLKEANHQHTMDCFQRHTGTGDQRLAGWVKQATDGKIMAFLRDVMLPVKGVADTVWTGYRILGTVSRSHGGLVWTFELFAKSSNSKTMVYTGPDAPNVRLVIAVDRITAW